MVPCIMYASLAPTCVGPCPASHVYMVRVVWCAPSSPIPGTHVTITSYIGWYECIHGPSGVLVAVVYTVGTEQRRCVSTPELLHQVCSIYLSILPTSIAGAVHHDTVCDLLDTTNGYGVWDTCYCTMHTSPLYAMQRVRGGCMCYVLCSVVLDQSSGV